MQFLAIAHFFGICSIFDDLRPDTQWDAYFDRKPISFQIPNILYKIPIWIAVIFYKHDLRNDIRYVMNFEIMHKVWSLTIAEIPNLDDRRSCRWTPIYDDRQICGQQMFFNDCRDSIRCPISDDRRPSTWYMQPPMIVRFLHHTQFRKICKYARRYRMLADIHPKLDRKWMMSDHSRQPKFGRWTMSRRRICNLYSELIHIFVYVEIMLCACMRSIKLSLFQYSIASACLKMHGTK